jgi:hypothetical protein
MTNLFVTIKTCVFKILNGWGISFYYVFFEKKAIVKIEVGNVKLQRLKKRDNYHNKKRNRDRQTKRETEKEREKHREREERHRERLP